jgi:hypothetical protein
MLKSTSLLAIALLLATSALATSDSASAGSSASTKLALTGEVVTGDGVPVGNATIDVSGARTTSDPSGRFRFLVEAGKHKVSVLAEGYTPVTLSLAVRTETAISIHLVPSASVNVVAKVDDAASDASARTFNADKLPSREGGGPGVPLPIPGLPSETASGGVKAPQYFAPGVAGDHGEPIAQYIRVGDFLVPNNLPANAHGNGYADPNPLIADAVADADVDNGAFDVRHGNHAVDLAVAYGLHPRWEPFLEWSGEARDYDLVAGWSPRNPHTAAWLGLELAGGNGFLRLPEHRKQYKVNGERSLQLGAHLLTGFVVGYYGSSKVPGLVPIDVRLPADTIDPRQSDRTHTSLFVLSDAWQISTKQKATFSGYFRTYGLSLQSNFGDGVDPAIGVSHGGGRDRLVRKAVRPRQLLRGRVGSETRCAARCRTRTCG